MHEKLMALCFLLLLTVFPRGVAHGQEREAKILDPTRVPLEAARVEEFVPRGWKIITIMHAAHGKYVRETNTVRHIDKQKVFLEEATMQDIDFYQLMDEFRNPRSAPTPRQPR